jgi:aflatoxin B1 aldehyde reductase
MEQELVPCCRKFGLRIVIYNPLGYAPFFHLVIFYSSSTSGGFFAGKIKAPEDEVPSGGRFDPNLISGVRYRERYLRQVYFDALNIIQPVAVGFYILCVRLGTVSDSDITIQDKHKIRMTAVALRWCQHHSILTPDDGIIIGASSLAQAEQNCSDSEEGPLPQDLLDALDEAWRIVGVNGPTYWR